eukprot:4340065-Amphidinium_carterae.1
MASLVLQSSSVLLHARSELERGFSSTWTGAATSSMAQALAEGSLTASGQTSLGSGVKATMALLSDVGQEMGV